jgi:hypothetical protein
MNAQYYTGISVFELYSEVSYVVENLNTNYELERNVCEI